ncbi:MAG: DeoR/GlpR family DNA-binding transcription regulator [Lachnospiraceae bacterium]|nr:DeoR/GlpR family DNA-binding transcription regulator [Lachnospiraceae bacterium]
MHAIKRADYILSMLEKNKVVMVADLSREMGVTEETVRKDLEKLEKQERLCRVHGGAYLNEGYGTETPVTVRGKILQEEKELLGKRCLELLREKESIFLDCSTTALHMAKQLVNWDKKMTLMTNSLAVAMEVRNNPAIRLILFGGELNRDRAAFEGRSVIDEMKETFINKAFISSAGISLEAGITDSTKEEAEIRRQVIRQAKKCILMVDSTKIGRNGVYVVGGLEDVDTLVLDCPLERLDGKLKERLTALMVSIMDGAAAEN